MGKILRNGIAVVLGEIYRYSSVLKQNIKMGKWIRIFDGASLRFYSGCKCSIGNRVKIDKGAIVASLKDSELYIGNNVGIGAYNIIACHRKIEIRDNTILGPNVCVYDHDHVFSPENGVSSKEYICEEVSIGENCWIGAGTVILRGTTIGDRCLIGAGCVLKGNYPNGSIVVQKRDTTFLNLNGGKI